MWKLIELDAVMKILKEHYPDAFEWVLYDFIFKIKALPQIDIEEVKNTAWENWYAAWEKGWEY